MQQITLTVKENGQATLSYHGVTPMRAAMLMSDCAASVLRQLLAQEDAKKETEVRAYSEGEAGTLLNNINGN